MTREYHACLSYLYRENKNLTGTARYASCNTHLGIGKNRKFAPLSLLFQCKERDWILIPMIAIV